MEKKELLVRSRMAASPLQRQKLTLILTFRSLPSTYVIGIGYNNNNNNKSKPRIKNEGFNCLRSCCCCCRFLVMSCIMKNFGSIKRKTRIKTNVRKKGDQERGQDDPETCKKHLCIHKTRVLLSIKKYFEERKKNKSLLWTC